jgi:hypothetical protein
VLNPVRDRLGYAVNESEGVIPPEPRHSRTSLSHVALRRFCSGRLKPGSTSTPVLLTLLTLLTRAVAEPRPIPLYRLFTSIRLYSNVIITNMPRVRMDTQGDEGGIWAARFGWNEEYEACLILQLSEAIKEGKRVENGWKPIVWDSIISLFRNKGFLVPIVAQLKSKVDAFKAKWKCFQYLHDLSGWTCNEDEDLLDALRQI